MNYPPVTVPRKKSTFFPKHLLQKRLEETLYINNLYELSLVDKSLQLPITLDQNLIKIVNKEFIPEINEITRSRKIFDWIGNQVTYGKTKRGILGYRNAKETINGGEGVCGEMAFLYVILARASGLKSNYVSVKEDYSRRQVHHACASVYLPNTVLVDPAYKRFDVKHKSFQILSDLEMLNRFKSWRF